MMEQKKTNELGIAGMVLGIIGVTFSCVLLGGIVGIIGLCISIGATRDKSKSTGPALSGIILNSISIAISAIALIFIMLGFSDGGNKTIISPITNQSESKSETTEIPVVQTPDPVPVAPSTPIPEQESSVGGDILDSNVCKVGNSIENSIWKVSFVDAEEYDKIGGDIFSTSAKSGYKYLALFFEIENISKEEHFFAYFNFDSYLDGYVLEQSFGLDDINGYKSISQNIAPGMKHKGYLLFEVPIDWEELVFTYEGIDSSAQMNFKLQKTDL